MEDAQPHSSSVCGHLVMPSTSSKTRDVGVCVCVLVWVCVCIPACVWCSVSLSQFSIYFFSSAPSGILSPIYPPPIHTHKTHAGS